MHMNIGKSFFADPAGGLITPPHPSAAGPAKSFIAHRPSARSIRAFTLPEVIASLLILGIMITGVVVTYIQSHRAAEWGAYSLAANSLAMQSVEQVRGAMWDPYRNPPTDNTTGVATRVTNTLDIPISKTNAVYATNRLVVTTLSTFPPLMSISV